MYNTIVVREKRKKQTRNDQDGSLAQLGEHLPYKQRVIGSSPITSTITYFGKRRKAGSSILPEVSNGTALREAPKPNGLVVQLVRTPPCHGGGRGFESHPGRHLCGFSSSGRAPPCQGGGSEFEPRNPLHFFFRAAKNVGFADNNKIRRGNIHGVFYLSEITRSIRTYKICLLIEPAVLAKSLRFQHGRELPGEPSWNASDFTCVRIVFSLGNITLCIAA